MSLSRLMTSRRFAPLFWTQFLGAFNDNVFKNALVIWFTERLVREEAHTLVNLAGGVFILPYFLFSATAGQVADSREKSKLVRGVKLLEIGVMGLGAVALALGERNLLLAVLFLLGVQATLFGPLKYSILPQHLATDELVAGNGLVEMGTFVAILLGTILGGVLVGVRPSGPLVVGGVTLAIAVLGWIASRFVPEAPATDPGLRVGLNLAKETSRTLAISRETRAVFLSILGISWFWFYGALFLAQFPELSVYVLGGDARVVTLLLTTFSVGIGAGSLLCESLSFGRIEIGLVPFGSIGLSLFAIDLWLATRGFPTPAGAKLDVAAFLAIPAAWRIVADLVLIGLFGGFYCVPLYALIQERSSPAHRSRIIAANNILNAIFMVAAAGMGILLAKLHVTVPEMFLATALLNALVAVYIYGLVPEFLMRFVVWILVNTMYRATVRGVLEHVPKEGAAVVVVNHVSFVDALVVGAAVKRPMRFVMDHQIFRTPVLGFVFRTAKAIPIASKKEDPALVERAFDEVARALAEGELVCIFPEGKITYTGELSPFRPGIERILERTPVPVVPMALRGLWGSFFSRKDGAAMQKPPKRFWSRIELVAGPPVPAAEAKAEKLEALVRELRGDSL